MSDKTVICKVVAGGIVENNGRILTLQRSNNDSYPGMWELPSGKKEPLEEIETTVVRETKEETGLTVEIVSTVNVFNYAVEKESEIRDVTQINFLVKSKSNQPVTLSAEHQNFKWIKEEELNDINISTETKKSIELAFKIFK